jgi:hypothetical protein
MQYVVQTAAPPPPPPGAPKGAKIVGGAPANYLAEFTRGPYLYWAALRGSDASAKREVDTGLKAYYHHAAQQSG